MSTTSLKKLDSLVQESTGSDIARRAQTLLHDHQEQLYCRTDRLFAGLMALQWLASLAAAYWIAPRTWEGLSSRPHPHLLIALFLGGAISLFPIALAACYPGRVLTRHVIAVGQMLMSGLLIHLSGGRLETHFHVFGSLAFLAFYRDWRVLATASLVAAADHGLRGFFWPQSIFGTAAVEPWHWLEHVGWVVFTDIFLLVSIAQSVREMRDTAGRQATQEVAEAGLKQAHDQLERRVEERTQELAQANDALEQDIAERVESEKELAELHALLRQRLDRIVALNYELAEAYDGTIEGWSKALDLRDHETEGHSRRVTEMTLALAKAFGLCGEELIQIRRGALLHDIGKMGVPDQVLLKPGPLTDDEWVVMRRHPVYAYEMLSTVAFVRPALEIPYCHHEKWDGTGYPRSLQGEAIPLAARLFAIVDVWDALRSDRPYRRAWPVEKTRDHIASLAGTHFDPAVVDVFLRQVVPTPLRVQEVPSGRSDQTPPFALAA